MDWDLGLKGLLYLAAMSIGSEHDNSSVRHRGQPTPNAR